MNTFFFFHFTGAYQMLKVKKQQKKVKGQYSTEMWAVLEVDV